jgi:hypothetical protein
MGLRSSLRTAINSKKCVQWGSLRAVLRRIMLKKRSGSYSLLGCTAQPSLVCPLLRLPGGQFGT